MNEIIKFSSVITVDLIQSVGSDMGIAEAASQSAVAEPFVDPKRLSGFIRYLMKQKHGSPFEHNLMTFKIHAPIFVAREMMRHRAGWSYNERSARYSVLEPTFYVPRDNRPLVRVTAPSRPTFEAGTPRQYIQMVLQHENAYTAVYEAYSHMLEIGIAEEVARSVMPVGTYTQWVATCNTRSLMHFLSLRTHDETANTVSYPQYEIEMVARQMEVLFAEAFPETYQAFCGYGRTAP